MSDTDFAALMVPVAKAFWGEPNASLSNKRELRWGSNGGKSVNIEKGVWTDWTDGQGADAAGGGVIDFVMRELGCDKAGALEYLETEGFIEQRDQHRERSGHAAPAEPAAPTPEPDESQNPAPATGKWTIVSAYPYTDRDGNLLYESCRIGWKLSDGSWVLGKNGKPKKSFAQRRPDGAGCWIWGLKAGEFMRRKPGQDWRQFDQTKWEEWGGGERMTVADDVAHVLYRWPALEIAIAEGRTIFLPEGEKKADLLVSWGLDASGNSGGAKHWTPALAAEFRDADVVIMIDNDEAGRQRADVVAASLRGIARRIRVLDLSAFWPAMSEKDDVVDWAEKGGGTKERLLEIVAGLPDWRPRPPASRFRAVRMHELDRPDLKHEYLVEDFLERRGISAIAGESQSGKSFLTVHLCGCIAAGLPFWGKPVQPGLVLYQAGEGESGLGKRLKAWMRENDIDEAEQLPFVLLPKKVNLFVDDRDADALIAEAKAWEAFYGVKARLLVIDTFNKAARGANEISGQDIGRVLERMERIAEAIDGMVLFVHHLNRDGSKMRGHTSLLDDLNNLVQVNKLKDITDQNGRPIRTFTLEKNKDGERGKVQRFVLRQIILEELPDGKQVTTCIVDPPAGSEEEERVGYRLTDQERALYAALVTASGNYGENVPYELGLPPSVTTVVKSALWRDQVRKTWSFKEVASDTEEQRKARQEEELAQVFKRIGMRLVNAGVIGKDNDRKIVWLTGKEVRGFRRRKAAEPSLPSHNADALAGLDEVPF